MEEKITFDEFKKEEPVDRRIRDEFKEEYNEFLNKLLPTVLLEKNIEGDTDTVKLPKKEWQKICEKIWVWYIQMPIEKT